MSHTRLFKIDSVLVQTLWFYANYTLNNTSEKAKIE